MGRRFFLALVVMIALLPVSGLAANGDESEDDGEEETGSVSGEVVNGSEDGGDVAGLEVVLTRFDGMEAVEEYTTTVEEDGSFEFADLPVIENQAYLAEVVYDGIDFNSGMILLTQEPEAEREVTVYEQTEDPSVLRIISRGVVVAGADDEQGIIEILEIIALENESDRVFVGDESGEVLRLAVPENASEIAPQPGFDYGDMSFEDDGVLVSSGPVTPGSHNPMISYQIPYEGTSGEFSVGTAMTTGTLRVLVEEDTYDLSSEILQPAGQAEVGSENYDVLSVDSPVVGDSFRVDVSGLPRENWNLPVPMSTFLASIAAGVGLVIGAILIYQIVQRRKAATPQGAVIEGDSVAEESSEDELEQERLELASELNKLDADYERGDIDEDSYSSEREEILTELRNISLRMRGVEE